MQIYIADNIEEYASNLKHKLQKKLTLKDINLSNKCTINCVHTLPELLNFYIYNSENKIPALYIDCFSSYYIHQLQSKNLSTEKISSEIQEQEEIHTLPQIEKEKNFFIKTSYILKKNSDFSDDKSKDKNSQEINMNLYAEFLTTKNCLKLPLPQEIEKFKKSKINNNIWSLNEIGFLEYDEWSADKNLHKFSNLEDIFNEVYQYIKLLSDESNNDLKNHEVLICIENNDKINNDKIAEILNKESLKFDQIILFDCSRENTHKLQQYFPVNDFVKEEKYKILSKGENYSEIPLQEKEFRSLSANINIIKKAYDKNFTFSKVPQLAENCSIYQGNYNTNSLFDIISDLQLGIEPKWTEIFKKINHKTYILNYSKGEEEIILIKTELIADIIKGIKKYIEENFTGRSLLILYFQNIINRQLKDFIKLSDHIIVMPDQNPKLRESFYTEFQKLLPLIKENCLIEELS